MLESTIPSRTPGEIKEHAELFFNKIDKLVPKGKSILEFVRNKPIEYFAELIFGSTLDERESNSQESEEENKSRVKRRCMDAENLGESVQIMNPHDPGLLPPQLNRPKQLPTQSYVIRDTLKKITGEMMLLLQRLTSDMNARKIDISVDAHAAGYWNYIYNSAIYLQQMVNDVTVAHNSTISLSQSGGVPLSLQPNLMRRAENGQIGKTGSGNEGQA